MTVYAHLVRFRACAVPQEPLSEIPEQPLHVLESASTAPEDAMGNGGVHPPGQDIAEAPAAFVPTPRLPERFELASASTVVGCAPQYYSDSNLFIGESDLLRQKRIYGVGLHCNRDYPEDEVVCEYVGDGLTLEQAKLTDSTYHFNVRDEQGNVVHVIDASDPARSSVGRYVNAARYLEEQNCKFVQVGLRIFLVTIRAVLAGHELLGWYGRGTNGMCTKRRPRAREV